MKKVVPVALLLILSTLLFGCSSMQSHITAVNKKIYSNKLGNYIQPKDGEPRAKIIIITDDKALYDINDIRDEKDKPFNGNVSGKTFRNQNVYQLPSEKVNFGLVTPESFKGKVAYSFYIRPELHSLVFAGYDVSIISQGRCTITYRLTPENNKNYVFYMHLDKNEKGKDVCVVQAKEIIYENGVYQYNPVVNNLMKMN